MGLRKNLILRRPQSGRLEGRTRIINVKLKHHPLAKEMAAIPVERSGGSPDSAKRTRAAGFGGPAQRLRRLAEGADKGAAHAFGVAKAGPRRHPFDRFGTALDTVA